MTDIFDCVSTSINSIISWLGIAGNAAVGFDLWEYIMSFAIAGIALRFLFYPAIFGSVGSSGSDKSTGKKGDK